MIKIVDKNTKETWNIYEKGDKHPDAPHRIVTDIFIIPLAGHTSHNCNSVTEALAWVADQISKRRTHIDSPKPATFWNP